MVQAYFSLKPADFKKREQTKFVLKPNSLLVEFNIGQEYSAWLWIISYCKMNP